MRDLTKSVLTLPWAMSLFGVQQMANFLSAAGGQRVSGTAAAFDAVTHATASRLDGRMK
jgi:hypothetical protein